MTPIRFGTDGWRAVIAEEFTFSAVERLSQATAAFWRRNPPQGRHSMVIVGYDTRFLSDAFARVVAEVFAGNDFQVLLSDRPCPTPSLSFAVRNLRATGGIMITASHNPGIFNGFKLKSHFGGAADEPTLGGVEKCLDSTPVVRLPVKAGLASGQIKHGDLRTAHFAAIRRMVNWKLLKSAQIRVAHDAMHGVGAGCFEQLLQGTGCSVTGIRSRPDPMFGGRSPEPTPSNYAEPTAFLKRHPHDICLVTDGDSDRIGGLSGRGVPLTTHQIICLLLNHLIVGHRLKGRVVKAITTSSMVDKICEAHGLLLTETGVGFKYICAEMIQGDVLLGVEESGGVAFGGHIPERDGLAAGLLLLELLALRGRPVSALIGQLEKKYGPHRYGRIDLHESREAVQNGLARLKDAPPVRLGRSVVDKVQAFDGLKLTTRDGSWLMLRGSGTEPVLRIYAESHSDEAVWKLLRLGQRMLSAARC